MTRPTVHKTAAGTRYLTEPGVRVIAKTESHVHNVWEFLDDLGFDSQNYQEDRMIRDPEDEAFSYDDDPGHVSKFAGQLCYLSFGEKRSRDLTKYLERIKEQGHGSVLEHVSFSLLLWGIDRGVTHEIVRHRAGMSFSQVSQRYVGGETLRFVMRPEYRGDRDLECIFQCYIDDAAAEYAQRCVFLERGGVGASLTGTERRKALRQAARACLPNETEAPIVVTGNARAWRHFIEQRASSHADRPIRELGVRVWEVLQTESPSLFGDYYPDGDGLATPYRKV